MSASQSDQAGIGSRASGTRTRTCDLCGNPITGADRLTMEWWWDERSFLLKKAHQECYSLENVLPEASYPV
jgi:hypothetical protein